MRELVDLVLALPPLVLIAAPGGFVFVAVPAALLGDTGGYVLNAVEGGHRRSLAILSGGCLDCRMWRGQLNRRVSWVFTFRAVRRSAKGGDGPQRRGTASRIPDKYG